MSHRETEGGRSELVEKILPRTVVGLALWLLMFALGASISGVVFFVAYERRLTTLQERVTSVQNDLQQRLSDAVSQLQNADKAIAGGVTTSAFSAGGSAARLLAKDGPAVVVVEGVDAAGDHTAGSGFVLNSTDSSSWVLTSYNLVAGTIAASQAALAQAAQAAASPSPSPSPSPTPTVSPRPPPAAAHSSASAAPASPTPTPSPSPTASATPTVTVLIQGGIQQGIVNTWDASHNLALIVVNKGKLPTIALSNAVPASGLAVYALIADTGGPYDADASQGSLTSASSQTLSTSATIGPNASGGPLVDQEGKVVGVLTVPQPKQPSPGPGTSPGASPTPAPSPSLVPGSAVPVRLACLQVVVCKA